MARFTRRAKRVLRILREARMFARAMQSSRHPIVAQMVVTRRCNLACAYCNEFDRVSPPVPAADLLRRVDRLADLRTAIIALSGGEPLLHPDIDAIVARIRERRAMAVLLTNGFLLDRDRIRRLNRAGLDYLQISIDNLKPDAVSKKSLSLLDRRLEELAACATFQVTINSVVGAGGNDPEDAHAIALRARALGFTSTVGVLHDGAGQLRPLGDRHRDAVDRILRLAPSLFSFAQLGHFQGNVIRGLPIAGIAGRGAAFSMCAKTASCTTARSNEAGQGSPSRRTRRTTSRGRRTDPNPARRSARCPASTRSPCWTGFVNSRTRRWQPCWTLAGPATRASEHPRPSGCSRGLSWILAGKKPPPGWRLPPSGWRVEERI